MLPSSPVYSFGYNYDRLRTPFFESAHTSVGKFALDRVAGGLNLYGYVGNGPIGAVDPLGLITEAIFDRKTGNLTVEDLDTHKSVTVTAFSGGMYDPNTLIPTKLYHLN